MPDRNLNWAGCFNTARATLFAILESLDVPAYLRSADLADADLSTVRARLLSS